MTRRLVPWSLGLAALAPASSLAGPGDLAAPEPAPKAIHGGLDAATCQFPAAVAMLDQASESLFCTGSLVHPQVVLLAAHCIDPNYSWATPGYAAFGEHADAPAFKVPVERDCYCTNRCQRVEIGEKSCLSINGKLFEAQCYMSENTPGWRRLGEGCRERPLAAAQQSTTG